MSLKTPFPAFHIDESVLMKLLVDQVVDYAIFMLTPEGVVATWNAGARRIKGYAADEIIGQHFSHFYTEEDRAAGLPAKVLGIALREGRFEGEGWRVRKDGTRFHASIVIDAIRGNAGELIGFAKITRDITQRLLLEHTQAALQQAQKLEAVGKLTGGVAHDFNNILQVVSGNLQLLRDQLKNDQLADRYLTSSIEAVARGAKLSSQLLAFARKQPLQPVVVNPGRVVRGMEDLVRRAIGETVEVEIVVSGGLWNTMLDAYQLENVILNLAINAHAAMPDGGKLTIEVGNAMLDDSYVMSAPDVLPGQFVMLAITDTGTGMSKDVLERAVEPFFTTKPEGQGTGLGLSMAFGFVKQSGGHFRIYSELGHGTTIKMYFPRSMEPEALIRSSVSAEVTGGTETVLVVEDDVEVQNTVVEMLATLGYKVLKADNAENALAVLKSGMQCDLLFTDVVMPGPLKSTELARQAKELFPDIEVLFTSGYTQNAIIHGGRLDPGVHLLSKPYTRETLAQKVRQVLEAAKRRTQRRILVVEDNADSLHMCCEMLELLGHRPRGVGSAEEAMKVLSAETFDMLLTDVSLPGKSGIELAKLAKQQYPAMRIVFSSGYADVGEEGKGLDARLLPKPYDMDAMKKALK
ncbi:MAG TPA: response regulator [Oxalicibacterium sp.]|nr:response regulator [Oxalicibacterium sp.]